MYVQPNIYYTDNSEYIDLTTYNFIQHSTSLEANRRLFNLKKNSPLFMQAQGPLSVYSKRYSTTMHFKFSQLTIL
jgi:hypothetical protein